MLFFATLVCILIREYDCRGPNLALNKPSHLSTLNGVSYAFYGNDGNKDCTIFAHTADWYNQNYYYVDLEETIQVESVDLYRRSDCPECLHRWEHMHVGVAEVAPSGTLEPGQDFSVCKTFPVPPAIGSITTVDCNIKGRYVILLVPIYDFAICEIEVYGQPATQAGHIKWKKFHGTPNVVYNGTIYQEDTVATFAACANSCVQETFCTAVSYFGDTCRMHYLQHRYAVRPTDQLVPTLGASYIELLDQHNTR